TLAGGLEELASAPIFDQRWFDGLADTRRLLREAGDEHCEATSLKAFDAALQRARATPPTSLAAVWRCVDELAACATALRLVVVEDQDSEAEAAPDKVSPIEVAAGEAAYWMDALVRQSTRAREELMYLTPWVGEQPSGEFVDIAIPSLRDLASGRGVP